MLDHIGIAVSSIERSRAFYDRALASVGVTLLWTVGPEETGSGGTALGYGSGGKAFFWLEEQSRPGQGVHIAFRASNRDEVDAFHAAALAAGGRDNGAPGVRPHYHAHYYGAFVYDPDGNNLEAVCHSAG